AGLPTRDYRQERDVVERARQAAVEYGLTPSLGEELVLALIRGSLTIQEKDTVAASGEGSGRRRFGMGGSGHRGGWFVRYFAAQVFTVESADPTPPTVRHANIAYHADWRALELDHELIVIAAPMPATNGILEELAQKPPRGVV